MRPESLHDGPGGRSDSFAEAGGGSFQGAGATLMCRARGKHGEPYKVAEPSPN